MVMRPIPYFIHCQQCGWERYQRTHGCELRPEDLERPTEYNFDRNRCPECGNTDLTIKPANTIKGKLMGLLWDIRH